MKILIFGSNGMLGRYLVSYLGKKNDILGLTRNDLDIFKEFISGNLIGKLRSIITDFNPDYIINCSGIINKRDDIINEMYVVNSNFPHILDIICRENEIKLIHPSTDCVFAGNSVGWYGEKYITDCSDNYGISKSIAESIQACIIRVSIIGEETNSRSLVEWVKSNKGKSVNGYTNHFWNGITCLQYAKIIQKDILDNEGYWIGVRNYASKYKSDNYITKYDLIKEISRIYELNLNVRGINTEKMMDRTLFADPKNIIGIDIVQQIQEMKDYYVLE